MTSRILTAASVRRALPALLVSIAGCRAASGHTAERVVERGDAERGKQAIAAYGCGSCHINPGIRGAEGLVGPPLIHWSGRRNIAGEVPNEPER
jgi:hypothetical protein